MGICNLKNMVESNSEVMNEAITNTMIQKDTSKNQNNKTKMTVITHIQKRDKNAVVNCHDRMKKYNRLHTKKRYKKRIRIRCEKKNIVDKMHKKRYRQRKTWPNERSNRRRPIKRSSLSKYHKPAPIYWHASLAEGRDIE